MPMNRNARIAATAGGTSGRPAILIPARSERPWSIVTTYAPHVSTAPATNISQPYFMDPRPREGWGGLISAGGRAGQYLAGGSFAETWGRPEGMNTYEGCEAWRRRY